MTSSSTAGPTTAEAAALLASAYGDDAARYRASGDWRGQTIVEVLRGHAAARPDALAVATVEGALTWSELDEQSDVLGAGLLAGGLEPGDPVIFQMGNELEAFLVLIGVLKAGLVPVCSIPNHRLHEVMSIAQATGARAHVFQAEYRSYDLRSLSADLERRCPSVALRLVVRGPSGAGATAVDDLIGGIDPTEARRVVDAVQADVRPGDIAVYQLSGGTTGVPKVIPHTHDTYLSIADRWSSNLGFDEQSVNLHFLPMMHRAGLGTVIVPTMFAGGTVVLSRGVDAAVIAGLIERYRVSWMHFNVAAFRPLADLTARAECDLGSVARFTWAFVRPDLAAAAEVMLDAVVVGSFGMGEGVHLSARPDDADAVRRFTVGCSIGALDEVVVRRPGSEEVLPNGEVGELTFRGPGVIRRYLSSEHNVDAFTTDGFLRSGDLGRAEQVEGRRCFTVEGRLKDQISRGGEKVMAAEVESLLLGHPAVREIAAIGVPDPDLGERICVAVVPEAALADVDPEGLRADLVRYLDDRQVAKFKWPERLVLVDELPKTGVGKVQKDLLRDRVASMNPTEGGR
jgi:non-ribosomal peptide synthetase component E (peptide arylation enzyme)